jgi:hypothetical protein
VLAPTSRAVIALGQKPCHPHEFASVVVDDAPVAVEPELVQNAE